MQKKPYPKSVRVLYILKMLLSCVTNCHSLQVFITHPYSISASNFKFMGRGFMRSSASNIVLVPGSVSSLNFTQTLFKEGGNVTENTRKQKFNVGFLSCMALVQWKSVPKPKIICHKIVHLFFPKCRLPFHTRRHSVMTWLIHKKKPLEYLLIF